MERPRNDPIACATPIISRYLRPAGPDPGLSRYSYTCVSYTRWPANANGPALRLHGVRLGSGAARSCWRCGLSLAFRARRALTRCPPSLSRLSFLNLLDVRLVDQLVRLYND